MIKRANSIYFRYVGASLAALGFDIGGFLLLLEGGMAPALAAGLGYMGGIAVHWLISSRLVFAAGAALPGLARHRQKLLFFLSAIVGLLLTMGIVGLGSALGLDPRLAKLAAIAVSFNAVYMLRKKVVFAL